MNSPLARGSLATTARGRAPPLARSWPSTTAAAWASCIASSAVSRPFARPRTPSVPNNVDIGSSVEDGLEGCRSDFLRDLPTCSYRPGYLPDYLPQSPGLLVFFCTVRLFFVAIPLFPLPVPLFG